MQQGHGTEASKMRPHRRTTDLLLMILFAGMIGEVVLETIAWFVSPAILGVPMRPFLLIEAIGERLLGMPLTTEVAVTIHLLLGAAVMPLCYVGLRRALRWRSWFWTSVTWGVALWLIAQAVLAPLAGRPVFLGFVAYSWGSLGAHVIYAVTVGYGLEYLTGRFLEESVRS